MKVVILVVAIVWSMTVWEMISIVCVWGGGGGVTRLVWQGH